MADLGYVAYVNALSKTEEGTRALEEISDLEARLREAERSNRELRSENMRLRSLRGNEPYSDKQRIGLVLKSISLPHRSHSVFDQEKVLDYSKSNQRRRWDPKVYAPHHRDNFLAMETLNLAYYFVKQEYEV
jgi:hypothetical protein